ncbi:MAG TPA: type II toxin-antitoxin system prevent-host-death family antitoxin [Bryobacteraceae bacterium]|nr:type II toxin-antitoxin system prevent-host-death family antitoxin [Bryobacteraceae bacterium]
MGTVNVAELKNKLSSFLQRARAGEEIVIRDRNLPIAKIVPLAGQDMELDEASLVASGQMTLPRKKLNEKRFWAIGRGARPDRKLKHAIQRAIEAEREERDAGLLGHKRHHPHLRSRPSD